MPDGARAFDRDMRTFFKAKNPLKQDEIAADAPTAAGGQGVNYA